MARQRRRRKKQPAAGPQLSGETIAPSLGHIVASKRWLERWRGTGNRNAPTKPLDGNTPEDAPSNDGLRDALERQDVNTVARMCVQSNGLAGDDELRARAWLLLLNADNFVRQDRKSVV